MNGILVDNNKTWLTQVNLTFSQNRQKKKKVNKNTRNSKWKKMKSTTFQHTQNQHDKIQNPKKRKNRLISWNLCYKSQHFTTFYLIHSFYLFIYLFIYFIFSFIQDNINRSYPFAIHYYFNSTQFNSTSLNFCINQKETIHFLTSVSWKVY